MSARFDQQDYEITRRDILYQGFFRLVNYELRFRLFEGGWSNLVTRELLERKPAAAVLPYDPERDEVVLIEQFRPGAIGAGESPWLTEIVAGILDGEHETAAEVATREASEEAGCEILALHPVCEYFVSPGGANEQISIYCGRVSAPQTAGIFGLATENENIRAFTLPLATALHQLQQGQIRTAPAIIALQWLQLHQERLKQLWQIK